MKKKEKRGLLILIVVAVLIIGVIWFVTRPKEETKVTNNGTNAPTSNAAQGQYTKVEENGTIVNTSEKLKENKEEEGFELTNISLKEENGETVLSARVTNKTGKAQEAFLAQIVLLDKKGKEIGKIPVMLSDMQEGEAIDVEASITESYANAYNFKLEK